MAILLFTDVLRSTTGLPEDDTMVNWVHVTASPGYVQSEADAMHARLNEFWNLATATANKVSDFIGPTVSRLASDCERRVYNITNFLAGQPHGSPVHTFTWSMAAPTAEASRFSLPREVAVTLSFNASFVGAQEFLGVARPRARLRGRIFVGPLNDLAATAAPGVANDSRPSTAIRSTLAAAAARLRDTPDGAWSVWSRTNASVEPVVAGWVDDAFDTQRRRGVLATARTTF